MVEVKAGNWARINGDRMFVVSIDDRQVSGLVQNSGCAGCYTKKDVPLQDLKEVSRSRKPPGSPRYLVPDKSIMFGRLLWNESEKSLHQIQFIREGRLHTIGTRELVQVM